MIEVQAARGLQDSLARAAVQDPTTDRKQGTLFLPERNLLSPPELFTIV